MTERDAAATIVWNAKTRQFEVDGAPLSSDQVRAIRDQALEVVHAEARDLLTQLYRRQITRPAWLLAMQALIRNAARLGFLLGAGGENAGAPEGALHDVTDYHLDALNGFLLDITNEQEADQGEPSSPSAGLLARAGSYGAALLAAFAAGKGALWGAELPIMPPLHPHCKCDVDYSTDDDGHVLATWIAQPDCCVLCDDAGQAYQNYDTGADA